MRRCSLVLSLPALLAIALTIVGQGAIRSLEPGVSVKKTLSSTQTHSYTVTVETNQFVQLTVQQLHIDVVLRVFLPDGTLLREFDSPTGTEGVEYVEFVAESSGNYRVDVVQLAGGDATGQYEIKIQELRKATEQELQSMKNERTRKAKGLALLTDTMPSVDQLRLPETRVEIRIKAAQLMWKSDQKGAAKLFGQAAEDVRELIARMTTREETVYDSYQLAMQLRQRLIRALAPHDPEAALKFLQSTRIPAELAVTDGRSDPELPLEFQLANQVVAADPKRAFDLAQDLLKRTSSALLIETLTRLASKDRELAGRLAHDMVAKLTRQDLVKTREAAYLAASLLNVVRSTQTVTTNNGDGAASGRIISDQDYRDLFLKLVAEVMSYSPSFTAGYTPEHDAMRSLAAVIRQMPNELKTYAADRAASVDKKVVELIGYTEQQPLAEWQRYQTTINSAPVEAALESVTDAPAPMRDFLYQQVATRIATSGDAARARQIISEHVTNPAQRQAALFTLQQQEVNSAVDKGRYEEAFRLLSKFRAGAERDAMVTQILDQLSPGVKKPLALQYLAQGKNMITSTPRAGDQEQMHNLLALARVFARYDVNQAFEIVEPLLDQFNEVSAAAVTMNGFDRHYYREGELITSNENPIAQTANHFSDTLAELAMFDFDRAKTTAEGLNRLDVRIRAFLLIAQRTMEIPLEPDESMGYNSNE
ncbi:MAG TPA: PPC domain-containing protein [Pyrinomonadaceae bacterium]|nr:PPC domain-containing protein [Pyrinomonadaceae bacterium]